jgi:hypothetical protein
MASLALGFALELAAPLLVRTLVAPALAASKPYHIAGGRRDAERKWQEVDQLDQTLKGVTFRIRFLDAATARGAIAKGLGRDLDLLPGRVDERAPGYLVFVLEVANDAAQDVNFNPGQARLATDKGDMNFALDYSALYGVAMRLGPDAPSLEVLATIFFDRAVTIRPGGSVRKLLAFEAPKEDRFKGFEVILAEVNVGPLATDAVFQFRKFFEQ